MVHEILNSVKIPQVIFPEDTGFSTGEVNYYTTPCDIRTAVNFYFEDQDLPVEQLQQRFEDELDELKRSERP